MILSYSAQGDSLAQIIGSPSEYRLKLTEPLFVGVVAPESGRAFKLSDTRIERAVLVMGRAEIA